MISGETPEGIMAKETTKKGKTGNVAAASASRKKPAPARKPAVKKPAMRVTKARKVVKAVKVQKVVKGAKKLAKSPATTEIVAATLVAAAAAIRDPKKAKALALSAADDLKKAAKSGADGGALWQLALDVARRSIDAIGKEDAPKKAKKAKPKKKK
jgi:hypothetical protein